MSCATVTTPAYAMDANNYLLSTPTTVLEELSAYLHAQQPYVSSPFYYQAQAPHHFGSYPTQPEANWSMAGSLDPSKDMLYRSTQPRLRTAQACRKCQLRKVKCTGESTCARCARRGLICEYAPQQRTRGSNKPKHGSPSPSFSSSSLSSRGSTPDVKQERDIIPAVIRRHCASSSKPTTSPGSAQTPAEDLTFSAQIGLALQDLYPPQLTDDIDWMSNQLFGSQK
ncbi:hypothetical protein OE88DRAFT_173075 [Heliocybe sulcata]|uniref:Zn(2)-C6 fungal-type domain-containing protein n=1 Tax=Heliocybe sulcata TaxID=5364 RepID=A0A5C3MZW1_9AGAM|nr:hypothetical protein OE88DRAFT_173075 [Heliocybe sulcata]